MPSVAWTMTSSRKSSIPIVARSDARGAPDGMYRKLQR